MISNNRKNYSTDTILNSVLRFSARPSSVLLFAIGFVSPSPLKLSLSFLLLYSINNLLLQPHVLLKAINYLMVFLHYLCTRVINIFIFGFSFISFTTLSSSVIDSGFSCVLLVSKKTFFKTILCICFDRL